MSPEHGDGYDRDLFRHWSDLDGNGCDTRRDVLAAEAVRGKRVGCDVAGGMWVSVYDGVRTSNPSSFDIDHMVPLKEAWDSGAWRWDALTRERYANDVALASALIAVTASSNRSKSDRDPAEWLPARARCAYAKSWVAVKYRWRLSVDTSERAALERILGKCPPGMKVPALAATTAGSTSAASAGASSGSSGATSATGGSSDPRFDTCGAANDAGYGPYQRGRDPEYAWYVDRDKDGLACES